MNKQTRAAYGRPLCFLLGVLALSYLLVHSLAGGTLLAHSPYDSYALMAENWLAGRNYIAGGENYPWLELAIYNGVYYHSFPPVPGGFELPWVLLFGAGGVPSHLVAALYGMAGAAGVYCLFARRGFAPAACIWWAAVCTAGSNLYWMSTNGGVWFLAQGLNFALAAWGLYFAAGEGTARHTLAAFLLALAVGCRPFSILLLAAFLLVLLGRCAVRPALAAAPGQSQSPALPGVQARRRGVRLRAPGAAFWLPVLAAGAVGAALAAYNYARFGSILEFGHTYLPEFQRLEDGQFSAKYLLPNLKNLLRPVTLTAGLDLQFPVFNGFLLFAANPVFLWWAMRLCGKAVRRSITLRDGAALACFAAGLLALCLHETLGGWQFGARYTVDLIPYVLLAEAWAADGPARPVRDWEWFLCAAAVLFNAYGAVYMLSH